MLHLLHSFPPPPLAVILHSLDTCCAPWRVSILTVPSFFFLFIFVFVTNYKYKTFFVQSARRLVSLPSGASGHRTTEPCVIHADAHKVILAVSDRATVFETRMWQPIYSVQLAGGGGGGGGGDDATVNIHEDGGAGGRCHDRATAIHACGSRLAVSTAFGHLRMLEAEGLRPPGHDEILARAGYERTPVSHLIRLWG